MKDALEDIYGVRVGIGQIKSDPAQLAVLPKLERLRRQLEAEPPKRGLLSGLFGSVPAEQIPGLYVWGGVGRGKSMLMDLFYDAVDIPQKRRVHFHAFMQEVHRALDAVRKTGVDDAILPVADQMLEELRLLCFDEMQISDIADAMIVGRLFERFFERGLVIVSTSNRPPQDLYKDGLNRSLFLPFIALLEKKMEVHELVAAHDYRQDRLAATDTYFAPVNSAARAAIERIWQDLADGSGEELVLKVQGREVRISQFRGGVARAKFWELCSRALGPADYLAIAEAVRVLILEDVPRLSRANFNEAKRFVTLIDALYEARVQLIVSAADIPEHLYLEGEGVFEFDRTASRLREMQSADWVGGA